MKGRRLPDTEFGGIPAGVQPGDYWKYVNDDGTPMEPIPDWPGKGENSNLTGTVWGYYAPHGKGIGVLMRHTVREHEDGTISVRPGDGSSNSILCDGGASRVQWHGFIEHGVWNEG